MNVQNIYLFDMNTYRLDEDDLHFDSIIPFNGNNGLLWLKQVLHDSGISSDIYPTRKDPASLLNKTKEIIEMNTKNDNLGGRKTGQDGSRYDQLYRLKSVVEADRFPEISSLWSLNHDYATLMLFGQYTSQVFESFL